MLKINFNKDFDRNKYYEKISKKSFLISKNEILKNHIKGFSKDKITIEELFNYLKSEKIENFDKYFKDISLKCLLIGKFETIKIIKEQIKTDDKIKNNKLLKFVFDYTKNHQSMIKPFFEDNFKIYTCYYCNIDFINIYQVKSTKKNKFTLDHYFDKSTYPYLALSLYNLIPSCYTCNSKLKKIEEFKNLAPNSKNFDFHQKVKFKLFLDDSCKNLHIKSKNDIDITLKEQFTDIYDKYIEIFKLNERYKAHKDIVFEMIKKAELYPESMLKELQGLTGIPFQQIKKDIFNLIDENGDLSKKPFSKLVVDISYELKLY